MRRPLLSALFAVPCLRLAACLGEDGALTTSDAGGGGVDAATSGQDATTGEDGSPGTDAGADAGSDAAPPYDIRSLTGLRLWLESSRELVAEAAGSSGFGSWSDGSGRWDGGVNAGSPDGGKLHAMPHGVNPPSIVANGFGGRPTVSFVAGNGYLHLDNHDDLQPGLGEFLMVEVAKVTSGSGPLFVLRPNATAGTMLSFLPGQHCVAFGLGVTNGCTTPVFTPSTEPHVFAVQRKSDIFTLRVDGSVRGTLDRSGDPVDIGVSKFSQDYAFIGNDVTMQVSELVYVVGPTTDAARDELERHLKAKYLIP